MKKYLLFIVSIIALSFGTSTLAKGSMGHRSVPLVIFEGVEVKILSQFEVDYDQKLGALMRHKAFGDFYVDGGVDKVFTEKHSGKGKKRYVAYYVSPKTRFVEKTSDEGRELLNQGSRDLSLEELFQAELHKRFPELRPAGPYELFSFVAKSPRVVEIYGQLSTEEYEFSLDAGDWLTQFVNHERRAVVFSVYGTEKGLRSCMDIYPTMRYVRGGIFVKEI